jgi:hypothetical protein
MAWLIILLCLFAGLHFALQAPYQIAIIVAGVVTMIIGLKEIFGNRGDNA